MRCFQNQVGKIKYAKAAEILVNEEEIIIPDEEMEEEEVAQPEAFDANLVDAIDDRELQSLSSDILSSVRQDKESRSEWEKTYVDGLKYLGMKFDESRSQPFEGSSGVIHPILAEGCNTVSSASVQRNVACEGSS